MLLFLPISPFAHLFPWLFRLIFSVMMLVALALNVLLYKTFLFWSSSTDPRLRGEHWLLLNPAGFLYRSWRGEQFVPWQQVQGIEQDTYNIYFLLKSKGPLARGILRGNRVPLFLNRVCIVPRGVLWEPAECWRVF